MPDNHVPMPQAQSEMTSPHEMAIPPPPPLVKSPNKLELEKEQPKATIPPPPFMKNNFPKQEVKFTGRHDSLDLLKPAKKPEPVKQQENIQEKKRLQRPAEPESKPEIPSYIEKPSPKQRQVTSPIYIKSTSFRRILEYLILTHNDLKQAQATMTRLNELKNEKDRQFLLWKENLEEIQRKLVLIDNTLFE